MYTGLLTNHSHICIHVFCTFSVLKVNSPSSCLYKTDGASSLIPKFSVFFFFFFKESKCWFQWEVGYENTILESFWQHYSRRLLMEAQILRAGPSLMFMVEMRWSSRKSSSACPSISWDWNWAASSSQPDRPRDSVNAGDNKEKQHVTSEL